MELTFIENDCEVPGGRESLQNPSYERFAQAFGPKTYYIANASPTLVEECLSGAQRRV